MKVKLLSVVIIASFVMFSISCKNKTGAGSTASSDTTKVKTSEQPSTTMPKKYDIKSGIVTYVTTAMGIKNSQKLYFDDYGAKELRETTTELEMLGVKSHKVTVELTKDGYRYLYDLENITNKENKLKKEIKKSKDLSMASAGMGSMASAMSEEMKKQYEYKEEGTVNIAGVTGTKYSMKMGKSKITGVMYKNIMLQTVMDMINITAEKFEENVSIPADKFDYPKDYTIVEVQ